MTHNPMFDPVPDPALSPRPPRERGRWWKLPVGMVLGFVMPFALIWSGSTISILSSTLDLVPASAVALGLWILGYGVLIGLLFWRRTHWLAIGGLMGTALTPLIIFARFLFGS